MNMLISPGVLQSSQALLEVLSERSLATDEFLDSLSRSRSMGSASRERVLEICQEAQWIQLIGSGEIELTDGGRKIAESSDYASSVRMQLREIIFHIRPPWAKKAQFGRSELLKMVPREIKQCFDEAGLSTGTDEAVVEWWDILANAARGYHDEEMLARGRRGERLSLDYERKRTGKEPKYVALDTAIPGYDILSVVSEEDDSSLCIEVKSSEQGIRQAQLHLSRNEYDQGKLNQNYEVHLWLLGGTDRLLRVNFQDVEKHCPKDSKDGTWESVRIPFRAFDWDGQEMPFETE